MISNECNVDFSDMKRTIATITLVFAGVICTANYFINRFAKEQEMEMEMEMENLDDQDTQTEMSDHLNSSQETADPRKQIDGKLQHIEYHLEMVRELLSDIADMTTH